MVNHLAVGNSSAGVRWHPRDGLLARRGRAGDRSGRKGAHNPSADVSRGVGARDDGRASPSIATCTLVHRPARRGRTSRVMGALKALGHVSARGPRPPPGALSASDRTHSTSRRSNVGANKRLRGSDRVVRRRAQNVSVTGWPPVPESAAARASAAAAEGNTRPRSVRRVPASTSSTSARSWDPSGLT